ncbi:MAG: VWA domain-containing protein [Deltaproteobacteria bacterium]|nr:VWA domain-containing protein [Deltaproteobacteria bacterium]
MKSLVILGLVVLTLGVWAPEAEAELGAEIAVEILEPPPGEAVFDRVEVRVRVTAEEPLEQVVLSVDGRRIGPLSPVPTSDPTSDALAQEYQLPVDVGGENRQHLFAVEAIGVSGVTGRAERVTPAIRIDEDVSLKLQQVFATVTDRKGRRVTDLSPVDISVRDNKVKQSIVTLGKGEIPFTAVLLLDASTSMAGPQLAAVKRGGRIFVDSMVPHDEIKLMVFADRLLDSSSFTDDAEELTAKFPTGQSSGGTALYDHLFWAVTLTEGRLGRRVVILLSDGADVHSVLSMEDVLATVRDSQTMLYWVEISDRPDESLFGLHHSFRSPEEIQRQLKLLRRAVEDSGGRVLRVFHPQEIEGALQEVIQELREQIAIGYYPQPTAQTEGWHQLEVKVRKSGLKVRTRRGYRAVPPTP